MRVSLAVIPLMLLIFSTDFSRRSSELLALKAASMSNAPGMTCASAKFRMVLSFRRIESKLPLTFKRANGQWALAVCSVGTVDDALEGVGCLSICDTWNAPDLLHGGKGLGWLVGSQLDNKVESSCNRRSGFDVGNALDLGNNVCTFSFAFGEYVACLIVSCHFFYLRSQQRISL